MLTPYQRKRCWEETRALGSQNISTKSYPRGAEISKKSLILVGGGGERRSGLFIENVCTSSGINISLGFPSILFGVVAIVYSASAHLGTCSSEPRWQGRCSKLWGHNGGTTADTAVPRRGIPSCLVFVALGEGQFRVRTNSTCCCKDLGLSLAPQAGHTGTWCTLGALVTQPIP